MCARPDKEVFHSYRDARRAARRIRKQSGYDLEPYQCPGAGHLHLTKASRPSPVRMVSSQPNGRSQGYVNRRRRWIRPAA